eukprot:3211368-Rhodomonas_salina.2
MRRSFLRWRAAPPGSGFRRPVVAADARWILEEFASDRTEGVGLKPARISEQVEASAGAERSQRRSLGFAVGRQHADADLAPSPALRPFSGRRHRLDPQPLDPRSQ